MLLGKNYPVPRRSLANDEDCQSNDTAASQLKVEARAMGRASIFHINQCSNACQSPIGLAM